MSHALAAARAGDPVRLERPILAGVVVVEILLLGLGLLIGKPFQAVLAGAGVAYFLLAFRAPDLAWALVWFTVPPNVEILLSGGTALTVPTEPMILLALLAWLLRSLLERSWTLPASSLHLPLAALASLALLSATWSVRPIATIKSWTMMFGYVAFGYLYYFQGRCDTTRRRRWLLLVALTGAVWGAFGVIRVLIAGEAGLEARAVASTYSFGAFRPYFREHGTYSAYLGMLLPAALLLALERKGWERVLYGLSALLIGAGVTLSFARAGWLAIALVVPSTLLAWALWRKAVRRLLLPAAIALAVIGLVAAMGVTRQVSRHAGSVVSAENLSNLERLNRWEAALRMAHDRPLTGVGYGCYLDAYPEYRRKSIVTSQVFIRMGAHSEPLKLLSEMGVPGLLVALWLLVQVWRVAVRAFRTLPEPEDRVLALAALAGLATYLVNGLFNAYLVEDKVTVPFWAAIGVIAALGRGVPGGKRSAAQGWRSRAVRGAPGFAP